MRTKEQGTRLNLQEYDDDEFVNKASGRMDKEKNQCIREKNKST